MLLLELNIEVCFFPFYCRVILFFVEKCLKNNLWEFPMLIPELCGPSTSTPDKQLNRQVFYFIFFIVRIRGASAGGAVT